MKRLIPEKFLIKHIYRKKKRKSIKITIYKYNFIAIVKLKVHHTH